MQNQAGASDPLRVLVVDDIKDNLKVFELALKTLRKDLGFEIDVSCVDSAEAGLKMHQERSFDLIMCDERLGGMNGTEFYSEVASAESVTGFVPFVIISAKATPKDWLEFYKAGVMDFLPKPITSDRLRFFCRSALRFRALRQKAFMNSQQGEVL